MPAPPTVEPDASPTTCIEINETWASWVSGRVWEMEHEEFWESDQDAAIDKASTLADIFASGNCAPTMTPDLEVARITLGSDLFLTATTRTSLGAPFQLTVNPDSTARYLVGFEGDVRNSGGTNRWLHMYLELPGQIYFVGNPIFSILVPATTRYSISWTIPTNWHTAGPNLIDFQYEASGSGLRFAVNAGAFAKMYTIWAERVI